MLFVVPTRIFPDYALNYYVFVLLLSLFPREATSRIT